MYIFLSLSLDTYSHHSQRVLGFHLLNKCGYIGAFSIILSAFLGPLIKMKKKLASWQRQWSLLQKRAMLYVDVYSLGFITKFGVIEQNVVKRRSSLQIQKSGLSYSTPHTTIHVIAFSQFVGYRAAQNESKQI